MNRVKELRLQAGLQQKDIAISLGIKQSAVSQWETQKSDPKPENIPKLASLLNVTPDSIIYEPAPWVPTDYPEHGVAVRTKSRLSDLSETDLDILARKLENRIGSGSLTPVEQELVDNYRQLSTMQKSRIRAMIAGYLDARYDNE